MTLYFQFLCLFKLLIILQAEWIEITQKPTSQTVKPKASIRILKKSEADELFNFEKTTPSPQWVAYQKERFGQKQNTDSHKLVVTTENQMKNSAKVIVPASNANKMSETRPKNRIIKTTTRVDVINDKPMKDLVELPHTDPQTTTKRDMNDAGSDDYEYVENVDDHENTENTENVEEENLENEMQRPSWQGFLKFMKRIQQYWIKHAGLTIHEKINYLKRLRDKLMLKIGKNALNEMRGFILEKQQFDLIWPSKDRPRRNERSLLGESNINFPPEFALMSINLLTFAVFLIKLTLLVVRLLKSKHYNITGLGLSAQPFMKTTTRN